MAERVSDSSGVGVAEAANDGGEEGAHPSPSGQTPSVVALVTGATEEGGIGYETAKMLADKGFHTVLAGRTKMSSKDIKSMELDLSSLQSIKDFVKRFRELEEHTHLNYLVHCDGVVFVGFEQTVDGFERHFQVNHLGPCLLTLELQPLLKKGQEGKNGARVVMLTSAAHSSAEFDPTNMNGEQYYSRFMAYYNSKLYNVMFAYCLQRRFADDKISVACIDPGKIKSNFINDPCSNRPFLKMISKLILKLFYETLEEGARRVIECITAHPSQWLDMQYFHQNTRQKVSKTARSVRSQKLLWERTMAAVKSHMTEELANKFAGTECERALLREVVDLQEEVGREGISVEGDSELQEMAAVKLALQKEREGHGDGVELPGAQLLLKMVQLKKSGDDTNVTGNESTGKLEDLLKKACEELEATGKDERTGEQSTSRSYRETSV